MLPPQFPTDVVPPAVKSKAPASERAKVMSRKSTLLVEMVAPEQVIELAVPSVDERHNNLLVAEFPVNVREPVIV